MACPSARSPANSGIRETRSGKILKQAEPNPFPSTRNRFAPLLGPVQAVIDQILIDDETAPPKQRHTAAQIFRRLRDEHEYAGGYAQVQRYLRKHRRRHRGNVHPAGTSAGPTTRSRFRTHPRRFPRRSQARAVSGHGLGLLERPVRPGAPLRAYRGDPRRDGCRLRVLRCGAQGSLVGQPQDRRHADPRGARTPVPSSLRGAGQPLRLLAALLHAGPRQREARRRRDRQGRAEAVRHAGASRRQS